MRDKIEKLLSLALTLAAIAIAISFIHSEFFPNPNARRTRKSEYDANWRSMMSEGRFVGTHAAPVTIVEFSDFQCPFCRRFNEAIRSAQAKYPGQVSYEFIHFPLPSHSQAVPGARAAECASKSHQFGEAVDFIFDHQDSLGKKPWSWFAKGIGVKDVAGFETCMKDTTSLPIVQAGLALGKRIDLIGTPTVYLNGWRYGGVPADTELVRAIGDILSGKRPYRGYPETRLTSSR